MSYRKIRKLQKRSARGPKRRGLKLGKTSIRFLSEEEANQLVQKAKKNLVGRGKASDPGKRGARKHYKKIRRTISLIRRNQDSIRQKDEEKIDSELLKSFYPDRDKTWRKISQRRDKKESIDLLSFSFIDSPLETLDQFFLLAKAEATARHAYINFLDKHCLDIAPYMVLGLMRKDMARVIRGGAIETPIYDVFKAVDLLGLLGINPLDVPTSSEVLPFKIKSRRKKGSTEQEGPIISETAEEKVAEQFSDTFNEWLKQQTPPLELTDRAYMHVNTIFGELLDNATRHSDLKEFDGAWHIAGFMETMTAGSPENPSDINQYACHFAIISLGNTIYESLMTAPASMQESISNYCKNVNENLARGVKPFSQEALWNVCAIQDGISRVPESNNTKGGFGLMSSLVSLMNAFGTSEVIENAPKMTIISGNSCVMIKYPYNNFTEKDGKRILAFNAGNDLDKPPDEKHVLTMPKRFPGTLITVRFVMDGGHLIAKADGRENDA